MDTGNGTNQEIESDSENSAENMVIGRDFAQINKHSQKIEEGPTKFPIDDPQDKGVWVNLFASLISVIPLEIDEIDTAFTILRFGSWAIGIGSFASVMHESIPYLVAIPFDGVILGLAIVAAIFTGRYFVVRDATDCPECDTPFGVESTQAFEYPELSDSENGRGERTVECKHCDYKNTEKISWDRSN